MNPNVSVRPLDTLRYKIYDEYRGEMAVLMFAAFSNFWNALVLPLTALQYEFSHTVVGAFGLVDMVDALAAARVGH